MARTAHRMTAAEREVSSKGRQACRQLRKDMAALGMDCEETRGTHKGEASGKGRVYSNQESAAQEAVQALKDKGYKGVEYRPYIIGFTRTSQSGWTVEVHGFNF